MPSSPQSIDAKEFVARVKLALSEEDFHQFVRGLHEFRNMAKIHGSGASDVDVARSVAGIRRRLNSTESPESLLRDFTAFVPAKFRHLCSKDAAKTAQQVQQQRWRPTQQTEQRPSTSSSVVDGYRAAEMRQQRPHTASSRPPASSQYPVFEASSMGTQPSSVKKSSPAFTLGSAPRIPNPEHLQYIVDEKGKQIGNQTMNSPGPIYNLRDKGGRPSAAPTLAGKRHGIPVYISKEHSKRESNDHEMFPGPGYYNMEDSCLGRQTNSRCRSAPIHSFKYSAPTNRLTKIKPPPRHMPGRSVVVRSNACLNDVRGSVHESPDPELPGPEDEEMRRQGNYAAILSTPASYTFEKKARITDKRKQLYAPKQMDSLKGTHSPGPCYYPPSAAFDAVGGDGKRRAPAFSFGSSKSNSARDSFLPDNVKERLPNGLLSHKECFQKRVRDHAGTELQQKVTSAFGYSPARSCAPRWSFSNSGRSTTALHPDTVSGNRKYRGATATKWLGTR